MASESRMPWDQLEDEPDLWYARFDVFRMMGASRSLRGAYSLSKEEEDNLTGSQPGSGWSERAKRFRWSERARAWDDHIRQKFRDEEVEMALDMRLSRLQKIKILSDESFDALVSAEIGKMSKADARAYLPQLRMLIVALIGLERVELGGSADRADEEPASDLPDELTRALARWNEDRKVNPNGNGVTADRARELIPSG